MGFYKLPNKDVDVKEHFKNAKSVTCLNTNHIKSINNKDTFSVYWDLHSMIQGRPEAKIYITRDYTVVWSETMGYANFE